MSLSAVRVRRAIVGLAALSAAVGLLPLWLPHMLRSAHLPIVETVEARAATPVINLPFNEGTGTTTGDASGNGNTGTLTNGPTWTTGKVGNALSFDGSNDTVYVSRATSLNAATTGLTVSAWVYRNANQQGFVSVLSRQQGTTFYERFYLGFENGNYRWFVNTTSGYSDLTLGGAAPVGQWIHLVGTYDGTDVKLYANGVLQFSSPHSGTLPTDTTGLTIGASYNDAARAAHEPFNGKIDEVNVYAQALTAQEIAAFYQSNSAPLVRLAFDEGSGTAAADSSGNGINGTLQNGAAWTSGRSGSAVSLDGIDDTVYVANSAGLASITNSVTVAAWVFKPANQTGFSSIVSREVGTTYNEHFYLGFENGNSRWFVDTTAGYSNVSLGGAAPSGQWVHMAGTYDGATVKLYVNGALQFSTPHSGTFASDTTGIAIGVNHNSSARAPDDQFAGRIDDLNIYAYALSAQEVLQLYQAAPGAPAADTTAPTVSLSAPSGGSSLSGSSVAVSATVSDNAGVAGVQFKLDGADLGSEDTSAPYSVTWNTASASNGSHSLTAVARDTSNNTTTSAPVSVTVSNGGASFDFSLSTEGAKNVVRGSSVTSAITATLVAGNTKSVSYSVSGLPTGATASVTPASCSPTCSATLTIQTASSTPLATSTITVTGVSGSVTRTTTFGLTVTAASTGGSGPIVKLPLDDGSGTTASDASGNGNNGALQNGPTWTAGRSGGALNFDGSNDTLVVASSSSLNTITTGLTFAAWVYRNTTQPAFVSVASRQVGTTFYEHFYLGFENGNYRWFVNTTGGYSSIALGGSSPSGQWVHLVGTYDGSTVKLYVNGALNFSTPHSGTFAADTTGITIGATHNDASRAPEEPFNGKVDDVNIYAYALTAQQVQALYQSAPASSGDTTQPTVVLSAPSNGATVSGSTVAVSATASDNAGVAGVQFQLDGVNIGGEDTSSPYSTTWNTTSAGNGAHTLTAVARDAANNTKTASVTVSVSNTAGAPSGQVLRLEFDEGTGTTATDSSGNGANGALQNGAAWTTGVSGSALNFDGVNDTLYIGNSTRLNTVTTGVTVAAWVYRNTNQSGFVSVASRQVGTTWDEHYYLGFENGNYRWFVDTTAGYSNVAIGGAAPLGQWVHLVGTYDGSTVKLYANGVQQFSVSHSGTFRSDTTGLALGVNHNDANRSPGDQFNGKVDELNVHSYALTAQQVQQLYQSTTVTGGVQPDPGTGPPTSVAFAPSPDHDSMVSSYVVSFITSGQAQTEVPVNSVNVGKPAVVNGEIQVNIASTISALASGSYYLVVSAVGTGGTSSGALSAVFSK
jgi:uncharacterized membrane protein